MTLKAPRRGDAQLLIEGRDDEFFRWLGPGAEVPRPVACVWVDDELVGWIDYDLDHDWLQPGQVNVGYYLFPDARRKSYASRTVELPLLHLKTRYGAHCREPADQPRERQIAGAG